LIDFALGLDQSQLGFDQHIVDPTLLLKKKGILESRIIKM
jgi:hypothetical protein